MVKQCEVCQIEIPADYNNLLCEEHYKAAELENARVAAQEAETSKDTPQTIIAPPAANSSPTEARNGITDPNYQENPEADDKEQWQANLKLFVDYGVLLWKPTRAMYEFIKTYCLNKTMEHPQFGDKARPKFIWRPMIVDVGCGIGAGSNIMSQEADFVWGIDKNEKSIQFAKIFERIKNGIYYSSEVKFDVFDILLDTRDTMKFDLVIAIEVIEHIYDYKTFLTNLIRKFDKRKEGYEATEYFISTPNRNNKSIRKDRPYNKFHCREWTQEEFIAVLSEFFQKVEIIWDNDSGEPVGTRNDHTPILAKCSGAKI